ncbi:MAG TPA: type II secretion system protein, partial [Pseudomonadales bacterium]|nr:type II secretion system protein [Pseudomonadales bacterium]
MKNGFSLIEALIALGIIGLCAAILPAFYSRLHQHSESDSALDNLHAALLLARAKALSEGDYVVICGQSDSGNCSEIFSHTLMVFSDKNRNGLLDGQETLDQI